MDIFNCKKIWALRVGDIAQWQEYLSIMYKTLGLIPNTTKISNKNDNNKH
jgi:hypothetical protein